MTNRIFLIGYMGVGKTTLGKGLAEKLGYSFIDLDHYIQDRHHKTIGEMFDEWGEERFRQVESYLLREVADFEQTVISTGGGTPCFFDNIQQMNEKGLTIYLQTDIEVLADRLFERRTKRPLIRHKTREELPSFIAEALALREPFYRQAKITYKTDELVSRDELPRYVDRLIELINNKFTNK